MATTIAFKDNTAPEIRCANFAKKMEELGIDGEIVDGVLFAAYNINTKQWGIWGPSAVKSVQINFAEDFCWLEYTYDRRVGDTIQAWEYDRDSDWFIRERGFCCPMNLPWTQKDREWSEFKNVLKQLHKWGVRLPSMWPMWGELENGNDEIWCKKLYEPA